MKITRRAYAHKGTVVVVVTLVLTVV